MFNMCLIGATPPLNLMDHVWFAMALFIVARNGSPSTGCGTRQIARDLALLVDFPE
jgi:hypothetical protein